MIRTATVHDAKQLLILNDEFNGKGATLDAVINSLENNPQEIVVVAEENSKLVGFLCIQIKKSFCYDDYSPEITELYVTPEYRRKGLASNMMEFAKTYCNQTYPIHKLELYTGEKNITAQTFYKSLGYTGKLEFHFSKYIID